MTSRATPSFLGEGIFLGDFNAEVRSEIPVC
jgi:hypothetical protein